MNSVLIDTNVLVYRFDSRDVPKQERARAVLRRGISDGSIRLAHQCLLEFVAATTRPLKSLDGDSLLSPAEAAYEAEDLERQCEVLYPNAAQFGTALRGWRMYGFSWFDAHLWSFAEHYGVERIYSEDFEHGRVYGKVKVLNPFLEGDL